MGIFSGFIHRVVRKADLEEFFVHLRSRVNFLRRFVPVGMRHRFASIGKFIPPSSSYPQDDNYFLTRDDTHYKINRSDYVQWRIFYGVRDNALRMAKQHLGNDSIVLDIGANFGGFSLRLATHTAKCNYQNVQVHAFEPNPAVFKRYRNNLALNPSLANLVYTHPVGLGSEAGKQSFKVEMVNTGAGRVLKEGAKGQQEVTIQRLDDFIDTLNPSKISFIKMIVEGYEPEVFRGGWKTIRKYRPPIYFEVTPEWYAENNSSLTAILDELLPLGYELMGEYYNELIPYDASRFASLYQFNMFALPLESRLDLRSIEHTG
jgi:FkbM family methyltransferase